MGFMLIRPTKKKTVVSLIVGVFICLILLVLFYFLKVGGIIISIAKIIAVSVVVAGIIYAVWSLFEEEPD
jgi:hypothetical protein